jgi:Aconitase family (aconitate hydratase)
MWERGSARFAANRILTTKSTEKPEPRLDGESIASVLRSVGAEIRESWCGPCFGQGPDALKKEEVAITSVNRNWQNPRGVGGLGYVASRAVVVPRRYLATWLGRMSLGSNGTLSASTSRSRHEDRTDLRSRSLAQPNLYS